jgi:hypothetical protein
MTTNPGFTFQPLPPIENEVQSPFPGIPGHLGPLADLAGTWTGKGFNQIWRPHEFGVRPHHTDGSDHHLREVHDHFLELNVTSDQITFTPVQGSIPDRGLGRQPDIALFGLTYLEQISDANLHAGLHIEPGMWVVIPATTAPKESPTVARMASIPHGTTIVAQGTADTGGAPVIPDISIKPFPIGHSHERLDFPEQDLKKRTKFRTSGRGLKGITQAMLDNPATVLRSAIKGQHITATIQLNIATSENGLSGGGTSNIGFLGANADTARVSARFWLETLGGEKSPTQLQYAQIVLLDFAGISWPHVTVSTLTKN